LEKGLHPKKKTFRRGKRPGWARTGRRVALKALSHTDVSGFAQGGWTISKTISRNNVQKELSGINKKGKNPRMVLVEGGHWCPIQKKKGSNGTPSPA